MADSLDLTGYTLTFDDEFNQFSWDNGSNGGLWKTKYYFGGRTLSGNAEQEYYSDASTGTDPFSILPGGGLDIKAQPTTNSAASGGLPYTSGLITTQDSFSQEYGYFEMRAELPAGAGLWPAFWLLPTNQSWPPEIDIMEVVNLYAGKVDANTHSTASGGYNGAYYTNTDLSTSYHTYGLMWTPTTITWYFDGQAMASGTTPADMHQTMYMLADLAVGGSWPGNPTSASEFPADMKIADIRAYSNAPNSTLVTPQAATNAVAPILPSDATGYVSPDATGIAHGPSTPSEIYATGDGQTLIGNGGDDVFNIGNHSDAHLIETGHGTPVITEWSSLYTLPVGINAVIAEGSFSHDITGNGAADTIIASPGNDVITGGGGNDTIFIGTGADLITGGGNQDHFIVTDATAHDSVITDFKPGQDALDLRGLMQSINYTGSDPLQDHILALTQSGADTVITVDPTGAVGAGHTLVTLQNVTATALHSGTDYLWH